MPCQAQLKTLQGKASITFTAAGAQSLQIRITDSTRRQVFDSGTLAGSTVTWDMRDMWGVPVPTGLYMVSAGMTASDGLL